MLHAAKKSLGVAGAAGLRANATAAGAEIPAFVDSSYEPCEENYTTAYLNRADVQAALHVKPAVWGACSNTLRYQMSDMVCLPCPHGMVCLPCLKYQMSDMV